MKKIKIIILAITLLMWSVSSFSAKNERLEIKMNKNISMDSKLEIIPLPSIPGAVVRPRSVGGAIVATVSLVSGLITIYEFVESHQTAAAVIRAYVLQNYNTNKFTIINVVYDNGCWKPEFPNNPFCYYSLNY